MFNSCNEFRRKTFDGMATRWYGVTRRYQNFLLVNESLRMCDESFVKPTFQEGCYVHNRY